MTKAKIKKWKKVLAGFLLIPLLFFAIISVVLVTKKDTLVAELLETLNEDFKGEISIKSTKISPFENFPYISIDLQGLKVFETKDNTIQPIISLEDVYVGFDLWTILEGKYDVKTIKLKGGFIHVVQELDNSYNLVKAFESQKEIDDLEEEFHLDLQKILLDKVEITKTNKTDSVSIYAKLDKAVVQFEKNPTHINMGLDADFRLNILKHNDTTFFKNKHFDVKTSFTFNKDDHKIKFAPSEIQFENGLFGMEGEIDFDDDFDVNLTFDGKKPNFDLLIAFAPTDLAETLNTYDNRGDIYFEASVKGKSINGHNPAVEAKFGCKSGFFDNKETNKKLDQLFFNAYFSNGETQNLSSSIFKLTDFTAKPEAGIFKANLIVKNFLSPEIDMKIDSDFDLDFLTKFFNLKDLSNLTGKVDLAMNFHDIIDLAHPERSLEKLNQAYYSELVISNLNFKSDSYHLSIRDLNLKATMDGNDIMMDYCRLKVGNSDLSLSGFISNIPAILHKTNDEVKANVQIESKQFDIKQLTSFDTTKLKPIDENIKNLRLGLRFQGEANTFIQSKSLPLGNFFIEDFYGKLSHYPHTFHDFDAKVFIHDNHINIKNFDGMIDDTDFHLTGSVENYNLWLADEKIGDTKFEFDLTSNLLKLKDLFSYKGENHVPVDYRQEEIRDLKIHGTLALHYDKVLKSTDLDLQQFKGNLKKHPIKLEYGKGNLHFEKDLLTFNQLNAKIGSSDFGLNGTYYIGSNPELKKKDALIKFKSNNLDFDELFSYSPTNPSNGKSIDHDDVFNIFEIPFRNMKIQTDIKKLNYHRYQIANLKGDLRLQENHMVFLDNLQLNAAGGIVDLKGYFNGSNPKHIYFSPDLKIQKVNLDEVLFKFDNFGQDQLVSENLHGIFTGRITGKILMHTDLTPIINESDLSIDVSVVNGRLEKFGPMDALSDFFKDKNLSKVLFDKLENRLQVKNGTMVLPNMLINSSLGFIEVSGKQDADLTMEYYVRVPLKLVTKVASQKLFGKKKEEIDPDQEDQIIYKDPTKKVSYVNLKISGTPSNYKISLQKNKELKQGKGFEKDESFLFESLETDSLHVQEQDSLNSSH
ncbi:AsmA-like protein [Flavobacterium lacus]|uniref:AsmA-like protein n=1 Tax=Flavobacterium lacus TaxID=1353778 RepID=A0A328WXK9_9FLAO|nr:AsmA-like protein [Flavobacterium lacus]